METRRTMRIISGKHKARKITPPPDKTTTRPIPDRVKEALFNLLRGHFEGATVLDCFAGTGSIGLEALSRGASRCVFVERDKRMAAVLQRNIDFLGEQDRAEIVTADAVGPLALARCPTPLKLAFLDPPYPMTRDKDDWERVIRQCAAFIGNMQPDGFLMVRTPWPAIRKTRLAPASADPPAPSLHGDTRPARKRRGAGQVSADDAEPALDAADAPGGGQPPPPEDIELAIPGADGPETHSYRHTAIHLYAPATT
ncbi:MAG: 16S rRNA (guanine(966)-N(2))-methyltransferase RsmD [Planctomycetota bacterium]